MLKRYSQHIFVFLIIIFFLVLFNTDLIYRGNLNKVTNIMYDPVTKTVNLSTLTTEQKVAQMIITSGQLNSKNKISNLVISGIHIGEQKTIGDFIRTIDSFKESSVLPIFVSADLEGCFSPFFEIKKFPNISTIKTKVDAYRLGLSHGLFLKYIGFTVNFAPVLDLEDNIWNCRSFPGSNDQKIENALHYAKGLTEAGIISIAKHYPGKTLVSSDPHKTVIYSNITKEDLDPFEKIKFSTALGIMVSHQIAYGDIDSFGKPSVVSPELIFSLKNNYSGLIVTDEINMGGLKNYYSKDMAKMYIDLFSAGNDLILNFDIDTLDLMISVVSEAIDNGIINKTQIDSSVEKILRLKGLNVVR